MFCPFSILGLARRPLLSDEEIGTAYRKLAGELHPDQARGDEYRFKELGEAAAILRDPAQRLRQLSGSSGGSDLPPKAAELFPGVAALLQLADALIEKHLAATNTLAKALLIAPLKDLGIEIDITLKYLAEWRSDLDRQLAGVDSLWPDYDRPSITLLADSYAYVGRWESQLRERKLKLDCL
jgi:curved DNA-binding protein CbpA